MNKTTSKWWLLLAFCLGLAVATIQKRQERFIFSETRKAIIVKDLKTGLETVLFK